MTLLDEDQIREKIRGYLDSREWWTIFPGQRMEVLVSIEQTFYADEKNGDFHLLVGGFVPSQAIAFAKKSHMNEAELEGILGHSIHERDIIVLGTTGEGELSPGAYLTEIMALNDWLGEER